MIMLYLIPFWIAAFLWMDAFVNPTQPLWKKIVGKNH